MFNIPFLRRTSDTFGLDIGSSAVKVVQLQGSSLVALGLASLPPDAIAEGTIKDPPSVVDVDGFALGNQFELNQQNERGEAVALSDIGASIMKTNVLRGGTPIFARDIPFGGNNYTHAIAQHLKIPFDQAESAKLGRDVGVSWESLVPALESVSQIGR